MKITRQSINRLMISGVPTESPTIYADVHYVESDEKVSEYANPESGVQIELNDLVTSELVRRFNEFPGGNSYNVYCLEHEGEVVADANFRAESGTITGLFEAMAVQLNLSLHGVGVVFGDEDSEVELVAGVLLRDCLLRKRVVFESDMSGDELLEIGGLIDG